MSKQTRSTMRHNRRNPVDLPVILTPLALTRDALWNIVPAVGGLPVVLAAQTRAAGIPADEDTWRSIITTPWLAQSLSEKIHARVQKHMRPLRSDGTGSLTFDEAELSIPMRADVGFDSDTRRVIQVVLKGMKSGIHAIESTSVSIDSVHVKLHKHGADSSLAIAHYLTLAAYLRGYNDRVARRVCDAVWAHVIPESKRAAKADEGVLFSAPSPAHEPTPDAERTMYFTDASGWEGSDSQTRMTPHQVVQGVVAQYPRMAKIVDDNDIVVGLDKQGKWLYAAARRPITAADKARWSAGERAEHVRQLAPATTALDDLAHRRLWEEASVTDPQKLHAFAYHVSGETAWMIYQRLPASQWVFAVFAGKSAKPIKRYSVKSREDAELHAQKLADDIAANLRLHSDAKAERKKAASEAGGAVKVGDIFMRSWGYDMTIVDFYKVVAVSATGKSVTAGEIPSTVVEGSDGFSGRAMPDTAAVPKTTFTGRVGGSLAEPTITIGRGNHAWKWDGRPKYFNRLN